MNHHKTNLRGFNAFFPWLQPGGAAVPHGEDDGAGARARADGRVVEGAREAKEEGQQGQGCAHRHHERLNLNTLHDGHVCFLK